MPINSDRPNASGPTPWWQLPGNQGNYGNLQKSAPPGYTYDPVSMGYVRSVDSAPNAEMLQGRALHQQDVNQGQQQQDWQAGSQQGGMHDALSNQILAGLRGFGAGAPPTAPSFAGGMPSLAGIPPLTGVGGGGGAAPIFTPPATGGGGAATPGPFSMPTGGGQPPPSAPQLNSQAPQGVQATLSDHVALPTATNLTPAQQAEFNRAKDTQGQVTQSAIAGLRSSLAGRGMLGSGQEALGTTQAVQQGAEALGNLTREEAIQRVLQQQKEAEVAYQGGITQRGQDINANQNAQSHALEAWKGQNEAAQSQYQQQLAQWQAGQAAQAREQEAARSAYDANLQRFQAQQGSETARQNQALEAYKASLGGWQAGQQSQQAQQAAALDAYKTNAGIQEANQGHALDAYKAQLAAWQAQQEARDRQQQMAIGALGGLRG